MGDLSIPHAELVLRLPRRYFFAHLLDAVCHIPPAFSHAVWVLYCDISVPDGLAAGDEDELPELPVVPGVVLASPPPDVVPVPVLPVEPEGLPAPEPAPEGLPAPEPPVAPAPELPLAPLPLPPPLPVCAAAIAGAKAMIPAKRVSTSFFIVISLFCKRSSTAQLRAAMTVSNSDTRNARRDCCPH
jgi:hypothetical protein